MLTLTTPMCCPARRHSVKKPACAAQNSDDKQSAGRLDKQQERAETGDDQPFGDYLQAGGQCAARNIVHLVDRVSDELRRISLEVEGIRLAKIDGQEPLGQARLHAKSEAVLPPTQKSEEQGLEEKHR